MMKISLLSLLVLFSTSVAQAKMYSGTERGDLYVINVAETTINGSWGDQAIFLMKSGSTLNGTLEGKAFFVSFNSNNVIGTLPCGSVSLFYSDSQIIGTLCNETISHFGLDKEEVLDLIAETVVDEIRPNFPRIVQKPVLRFIEPLLPR